MKKVLRSIFQILLFVGEFGALLIFIYYCGVWSQMTHPEAIPFTPKEIETTIIPMFTIVWIAFGIVNSFRDQRWKRQDHKVETTT